MSYQFDVTEWSAKRKFIVASVLLVTMVGIYFFVYTTGGIRYVFSHSMYLPIIVAAIVFGTRGGLVAAVLGGLILGPLMPIDTTTGEMQQTINWLYRLGFFLLVAYIVGFSSQQAARHLRQLKWLSTHDKNSGLACLPHQP